MSANDLAVGDLVVMTDGTEGRVLAIGTEVFVNHPDGSRVKVPLDSEMAYVEVTYGPGAGKPWGFHFVEAQDLEQIGVAKDSDSRSSERLTDGHDE